MNIEEEVGKWRKRFAEFVRREDPPGLVTLTGDDIVESENVSEIVSSCGKSILVSVRREGCVCEEDEMKAEEWLRLLAASGGVFDPTVDISVFGECDKAYAAELTMSFRPFGREVKQWDVDAEDSWIIGDTDCGIYMGIKEDGFEGNLIDRGDPKDAISYESYEDAEKALCHDRDVIEWVHDQPDACHPRPLLLTVITKARPANEDGQVDE